MTIDEINEKMKEINEDYEKKMTELQKEAKNCEGYSTSKEEVALIHGFYTADTGEACCMCCGKTWTCEKMLEDLLDEVKWNVKHARRVTIDDEEESEDEDDGEEKKDESISDLLEEIIKKL